MPRIVDNVNQPGTTIAERLLESLHELVHLLRANELERLRAAGSPLSPLESRVLGFYARHPGASQSDLVQHAGRDKAQVARLVQGLRDAGWLHAATDPGDRRVTRYTLSATAQRHQAAMAERRRAMAEAALASLGERETTQLVHLLDRLRTSLSVARDGS
ncbi:MAG: winged helix-turn-helix transcriptional regulator [Burkholderiaceae bacterium]|nr:winged helix-turn-helix transcriptional regulator [Burkholderiaceae bacterium]